MRRAVAFLWVVPLVALAALVTVACGSDDDAGGDAGTPTVVATTSILGDLVRHVAGTEADVVVLLGSGVDPHDYQPSARDGERIREADLVVANGGGLEEGLLDVIDEARDEGTNVLELLGHLDPLPFGDDPVVLDPHFWQDPVRAATAVELIGAELADRFDGPWIEQAAMYATELRALDAEIDTMLATIPAERRIMVTDHDAFGYFAARYGFEIVGVIIPGGTTLAAPSPKDLEELARLITDTGVPAIFTENTQPARLAEALASEVGDTVEVVQLYSDALGDSGAEAATYVALLRANAERIAEALA